MMNAAVTILMTAAAAAAFCLWESGRERRSLRTEHYTFRTKAAEKAAGAAGPGEGSAVCRSLKAVFLTDLHDFCRKYGRQRFAEVIRREAPDLLLLGGDIVTCSKRSPEPPDTSELLELIRELDGLCPCFYGEGNHETRFRSRFPKEYAAYRRQMEDAGVIFLEDSCAVYEGLSVWGLTLDEIYYKKRLPFMPLKEPMPRDYLLKKLGKPEESGCRILLLHSPMYLEEAAQWGADLVLSGHFHGGTVRLMLPGRPGLMTPQLQFFVRECSGVHTARNGHTRMLASRGLGTHSIKIRLNDLPEISVLRIDY